MILHTSYLSREAPGLRGAHRHVQASFRKQSYISVTLTALQQLCGSCCMAQQGHAAQLGMQHRQPGEFANPTRPPSQDAQQPCTESSRRPAHD